MDIEVFHEDFYFFQKLPAYNSLRTIYRNLTKIPFGAYNSKHNAHDDRRHIPEIGLTLTKKSTWTENK